MDLQKIMEFRNRSNPYALRMGIRVSEIGASWAKTEMTVTPEDLNPVAVPHGGVYFSLADIACGCAVATQGYAAVTLNCSFSFLRSAKVGDVVTAEAAEVKSGRTVCVFDARVTDQDGKLLATGTFTFYKTEKKLDL